MASLLRMSLPALFVLLHLQVLPGLAQQDCSSNTDCTSTTFDTCLKSNGVPSGTCCRVQVPSSPPACSVSHTECIDGLTCIVPSNATTGICLQSCSAEGGCSVDQACIAMDSIGGSFCHDKSCAGGNDATSPSATLAPASAPTTADLNSTASAPAPATTAPAPASPPSSARTCTKDKDCSDLAYNRCIYPTSSATRGACCLIVVPTTTATCDANSTTGTCDADFECVGTSNDTTSGICLQPCGAGIGSGCTSGSQCIVSGGSGYCVTLTCLGPAPPSVGAIASASVGSPTATAASVTAPASASVGAPTQTPTKAPASAASPSKSATTAPASAPSVATGIPIMTAPAGPAAPPTTTSVGAAALCTRPGFLLLATAVFVCVTVILA